MSNASKGPGLQLIGRCSELAAIGEAVAAAAAGRGRALLIAGEPGIGKSTLARGVAEMAAAQGLPVYWGFAWEVGGAPAYWPWTQVMRALLRDHADGSAAIASLAQLLPEAAGDRECLQLQPAQARFRLLETTIEFLDQACRRTPLVIILEDLHAADTDSLQLLHHVARHLRTLPLLLVGTFRDMEARNSPAFEALWHTAREACVLRPARFSAAEITDYLARAMDRAPSPAQVQRLWTVTEGNPLFLTELVGLLAERGDARLTRLPENVQQVIREQIDRLPGETIQLLAAASVIGRSFSLASLAGLAEQPEAQMQARLQAALAAGVIERVEAGTYRFFHVLCRNVLHDSLDRSAREKWHGQRAAALRKAIEDGDEDRWSELASQLELAGPGSRKAAVEAWRQAARRAAARLAYSDAVSSLQHALQALASASGVKPAARCALLLELAAANLNKGDIDAGQQLCSTAYGIAHDAGQARLMAQAALTHGYAIVAARIDQGLVSMLREALQALPANDTQYRAQVMARLASALQPAPNPAEPVAMAREAIALARQTGDEETVYEVLRSALSAMMDFAPAAERAPLNRESVTFAERFGDVPGAFRGHLRLVIDAAELGDRKMLDEAVDACERIALRIGLPHYAWQSSSLRALQATIEGRFDAALKLLMDAAEQARLADDDGALLRLPLQRLIIVLDWQPETGAFQTGEIIEEVEAAIEAFPDARNYVLPMCDQLRARAGETRFVAIRDDALLERIFAGGDLCTMAAIGELAALAGDAALAARAYERLLPARELCATIGLMGSSWSGPVALPLGIMAQALGRQEAAQEHLETALDVALRMRAGPTVARIHAALSGLAAQRGDAQAAAQHAEAAEQRIVALQLRRPIGLAAPVQALAGALVDALRVDREGELWKVQFSGSSALIRQSKGMEILARLVAEPEREFHVLDLVTPSHARRQIDPGDTGPLLDDRARSAYRRRVEVLREELEEAQELGDTGRANLLQEELDFIARELSRAFGLGGRARAGGAAAERARVNVQRRLRDAIGRITAQLPDAGRYLESTVKTGRYCRFSPL